MGVPARTDPCGTARTWGTTARRRTAQIPLFGSLTATVVTGVVLAALATWIISGAVFTHALLEPAIPRCITPLPWPPYPVARESGTGSPPAAQDKDDNLDG